MKKLLGLREQKDGSLLEAVAEQKRVLGNRSWCLEEVRLSLLWNLQEKILFSTLLCAYHVPCF